LIQAKTPSCERRIGMAKSVGTFGGYQGRAITLLPDQEGLLAFVVAGRPSALDLFWSFGSGKIPIGSASDPAADPAASSVTSTLRGWVTLERAEPGGARALLSRAWPAVRLVYPSARVLFRTTAKKLLCAVDGLPGVQDDLPALGPRISEPWIVLFDHDGPEDMATLLTFARRITAITRQPDGYEITLSGSGAFHVMPLEGIARRTQGQAAIDDWIVCARAWVGPLLAFPVGVTEVLSLDGDQVRIEARFDHELLADEWGNTAEPLCPIPPVVAQAASGGYPITLPEGLLTGDMQRNIATLYGPFWFVPGASCIYSIPAPVGLGGDPPAPRSREEWARPIRAELDRIATDMDPHEDFVDYDLRVVAFLADALPELDEARRQAARTYAQKVLAIALEPPFTATEPVTGQAWTTILKTWRSHFSETADPFAKDNERFDSEFYNGQALSAIAAGARLDPALGPKWYEAAKTLYRYSQIFWDWAIQSVLTHATGDAANIDGVQFAWEGMLAMARLARAAGDSALALDATARAARQQLSIFAMWQHAAWMKRHDCAYGHVSKARIAAAEVETAGPIDAWVEEYGAAALEMRSFWQCTGFLFYRNLPLFELYRRYGLLDRIRAIEYDLMPKLHPSWQDGNAEDPAGENGQTRYGTSWTAAHLAARSILFGEDPAALFRVYLATGESKAADEWYRMQLTPISGPLMLSLLEGKGPG
jgi:hypothetical protein